MAWCRKNDMAMIAGHTHRPVYPSVGQLPYFNDGYCVHPRYITAVEICNGEISFVKWEVGVQKNGILNISKEIMCGPNSIHSYFEGTALLSS